MRRAHPMLARKGSSIGVALWIACMLAATLPAEAGAQQVADTAFVPPIGRPAFPPGTGPLVVIDAAHLNFHTASGGYQAFARLLRRDGYRVESNHAPFTADVLEGMDVLVVANALHPQSEHAWSPLPSLSAFEPAEIEALEAWVAGGGALMLIADHMPIAGHAESLAAEFGIRFQNGFALDASRAGRATFRRSDGSLASASVTNGRDDSRRVDSVTSFTGQAFRVDPQVRAEPLLIFPEGFRLYLPRVAWEFTDSTPQIPAAHLLQGVLVHHGQGRVAAFGEAAMFTAQLAGPQRFPVGMNDPAAGQNHRLALNVVAWLAAALEPPDSSALTSAFVAHDAVGTMVIRRISDGHEWVHAPARADSAFLPASTFKIANAAIALETGVVEGVGDRFEWDGVERGNAAWNRDHTLKSAMEVSAVPVYQQIARSIGPERMGEWLERIGYGNADIGGGIDRFWLTGALRTSAHEQVDFLSRLITGGTDFSPRTVEVVSDLVLIDEGPGWALHAKTGWADAAAIGWWSGWSRIGDESYVFALNMVMPGVETAPKRISIGREALIAVGALPDPGG